MKNFMYINFDFDFINYVSIVDKFPSRFISDQEDLIIIILLCQLMTKRFAIDFVSMIVYAAAICIININMFVYPFLDLFSEEILSIISIDNFILYYPSSSKIGDRTNVWLYKYYLDLCNTNKVSWSSIRYIETSPPGEEEDTSLNHIKSLFIISCFQYVLICYGSNDLTVMQ